MTDENEVKALADRFYHAAVNNAGSLSISTWETAQTAAREALRWRDETRPLQSPPAAAVPEGHALVPVEPTREMRRAAIGEYEDAMDARLPDGDGYDEEVVTRLYRAMLAAANKENNNG